VPPSRLRRPSDLDGPIPDINFRKWEAPLYRIQNDASLAYERYPSARHRFDAPAGQYAAVYANDSSVGVFGEVYVSRGRRLGASDAARHLLELTPKHLFPLVDLRDDRTLAALDLDARISVGDDYETCQQWALAFHERWRELRGVCYAARAGGVRTANVMLFAERCARDLDVNVMGRLADHGALVLTAADRYRLRVSFLA
jgi:hypothetical protein